MPLDQNENIAVNEDTADQYNKCVLAIRNEILEKPSPRLAYLDVSPTELANYIIENFHNYRPHTFIFYRSAMLYCFSRQKQCAEIEEGIRILRDFKPGGGFKGVSAGKTATLYSRASSRKRTFKKRKFDKLIKELKRRAKINGRHTDDGLHRAQTLIDWLYAGLASGLRPIEWDNVKWFDQEKTTLLVQTAKIKRHGYTLDHIKHHKVRRDTFRTVFIDEDDRYWVNRHLKNIEMYKKRGGIFKRFYNNNRYVLLQANKVLFENSREYINLYMLRGQFAANRKYIKTTDAVAEELGCSANVAYTSYGKRRYSHKHIAFKYKNKLEYKKNFIKLIDIERG